MNLYDHDIIMSIDIGLTGAIAVFDTVSGELLSIYDMPIKLSEKLTKSGKAKYELDIQKLKFIMEIPKVKDDSCLVIVEDVHAFPGQGVVSSGTLMEQKGIIRGLASALGYETLMVNPKTWQKSLGITPPKDIKDKTKRKIWLKENSRRVASELYKEFSAKFEDKNSHGRSDAVLIGDWVIKSPQ